MFMWGGTWIAGRIIAQELSGTAGRAGHPLPARRTGAGRRRTARQKDTSHVRRTGREWGVVTGLAITGIFLYALCFFYGLKHISAGRGALVVALTPVVVALAAWFLGQERMTPVKLAGVAIAHGSAA